MKKLVTCKEMKDLDSTTIREIGVPSEVLMERAALKVVEEQKVSPEGRKDPGSLRKRK